MSGPGSLFEMARKAVSISPASGLSEDLQKKKEEMRHETPTASAPDLVLCDSNVALNAVLMRVHRAQEMFAKTPGASPLNKWKLTWGDASLNIPDWIAILATKYSCVYYNSSLGCEWAKCKYNHTCVLCGSTEHGAMWRDSDTEVGPSNKEEVDDTDKEHTQEDCICPQVKLIATVGLLPMEKTQVTEYVKDLVADKKVSDDFSP